MKHTAEKIDTPSPMEIARRQWWAGLSAHGDPGCIVNPLSAGFRAGWEARERFAATGPDLLVAAKYALRVRGADCGDHCLNSCEWCELRRAVAKAEGKP